MLKTYLAKFLFLFILLTFGFTSFGQNTLDKNFSSFINVEINTNELYNQVQSKNSFPLYLEIDGHELELIPSDIIPAYYKSFTTEGDFINQKRAIPLKGYTKTGADVRLTVAAGFIAGLIEIENDVIYIEPANYYNKSAKDELFILYKQSEIKETAEKTCGVDSQKAQYEKIGEIADLNKSVGECLETDYPVAADFSYVDKYGGAVGAENQIITVVNNINTDYDDSFDDQIIFILTSTFLVTTSSNDDPWTTSTNPLTLLNSYISWGNSFWNGAGVDNDVSSLWTNRDFDGATIGLAGLGVVCTSSGYNVLQDFSSNADLTRVLVSHEIGHNFDATHDASGSLHIMAPSVQNTTSWSSVSATAISAHIASRTCLETCVPSGTTPEIEFGIASSTTNETSITGASGLCDQNFTVQTVNLALNTQPSTTITVDINVTGGTAENNKDYSLQTTSVSFAPGQSTTRLIDLHIFEDHIVEAEETIVLGFTVTSGTVDLGTNTSHTITISEDSDDTATGSPETSILYGNYNFNASSIFRNVQTDGRTRVMYTKADLNAVGIFAGNINSLSLFIAQKNSTAPFQDFRIGLANTTSPDLNGMAWIATDEKYFSDHTTSTGTNQFNFSSPFFWDGISNLYIQFCWNNTAANGATSDIEQHSQALVSTSGHLLHYQVLNSTNGCTDPTNGFTFFNIPIQPRIEFEYEAIGTFIESEINSNAQSNLSSGDKANLFSADNELIAIIENTGVQDIGCIESTIFTSGNGKSAASFGTGSVSDKTYLLSGDQSTLFDLTIYYTDAELTTWGSTAPDLNIVMSSVPLSIATMNDVVIVSPTEVVQDVFGNPQVAYKGSFSGFEYFGLTDVQPVSTITGDISDADLVINNSANGILIKDSNGTSRRVFATNGNVYSTTQTSGVSNATLDIGDLRLVTAGKGVILRKPNGQYLKLTVSDSGNLTYSTSGTLPTTNVRLQDGDLAFGEQNRGIILKSPSGACWRLIVATNGALSATPVSNCN